MDIASLWNESDLRPSSSNAETLFLAPHKICQLNALRRLSRINDELGSFNNEWIVVAGVAGNNHNAVGVRCFIQPRGAPLERECPSELHAMKS